MEERLDEEKKTKTNEEAFNTWAVSCIQPFYDGKMC